jgi:Domain of unknown function (DUF4349)
MTRGTWVVATAAVVAGALAIAACGGDGDNDSAESEESGGVTDEAGTDEAATGAGRVQPIAGQVQDEDRDVIYTADLVVRVSDVEGTTPEAVALAEEAGGLLFQQQSDLEGEQETHLTLKVPPAELNPVLESLGDLGTVVRRDVSAEDVTDQVVDLDGRLQSARASADRLRALLADAASTTALVEIEAELARRESEIESLEGQLRVLNSQVELATINLRLTERSDVEVSDDLPGFVSGLRSGWVALATIALVLVVIVGFLLPLLPVAGVAWWAVRRYQRGRRREAVAPS